MNKNVQKLKNSSKNLTALRFGVIINFNSCKIANQTIFKRKSSDGSKANKKEEKEKRTVD